MVSLTKCDKVFAVQDNAFRHQADSSSFELNSFQENSFFLQIPGRRALETVFEQSYREEISVYTRRMDLTEYDPDRIFEVERMKLEKR
jgi:hypothetical protein